MVLFTGSNSERTSLPSPRTAGYHTVTYRALLENPARLENQSKECAGSAPTSRLQLPFGPSGQRQEREARAAVGEEGPASTHFHKPGLYKKQTQRSQGMLLCE